MIGEREGKHCFAISANQYNDVLPGSLPANLNEPADLQLYEEIFIFHAGVVAAMAANIPSWLSGYSSGSISGSLKVSLVDFTIRA